MSLIDWSEDVREAYRLLCKAAKLDQCHIRELTVTFPMRGMVEYQVKGLVKEEKPVDTSTP